MPEGDDWQYEFKWDGVRAVVGVYGDRVQALSRNDLDFTGSYPELMHLPAQLGGREVVLDGELVALDSAGTPSFSQLQLRMHVKAPAPALVSRVPVSFYCFDLLALDGKPTTNWPYSRRRTELEALALADGFMQLSPRFYGPGSAVLETARQHGLEGVVAKQSGSVYQPGRRSSAWIKIPINHYQEGVIVGWRPGEGRRAGTIGSLLLAAHGADGKLDFIGSVGTGFTARMLDDLLCQLQAIEVTTTPVTGRPVPREYARNAHWCQPKLVGEVQFRNWTPDATMRHPSWRGLRPDKGPDEVVYA
jgi:bifunctional non-homologous end joining protein LigD